MKTKSIFIIAIATVLPLAGFAQPQPPAPPAPPAPPDMPGRHNPDRDKGPKVPTVFLGVETSPVPNVVSEQLGLPKGFGLVVDYVVPDSPAAGAGVQQNDIIKMLNDQILMEPSQLRKLLQSFSDGTNVSLTVLRKGQEQKITVKLTKKEMPQRHSMLPGFKHEWNWDFDDMGDLNGQMQGLKEQLKEQLGNAKDVVRDAVAKAHEEAERAREQAHEEAERAREQAREGAQRAREEARHATKDFRILSRDNGSLKATKIDIGKAQIVYSDDKGEMKLETVDGKKLLTAKDPQGKLLFSGPVETNQDLDKLPAEVRQRFDKLQKNDLPTVAPSDEGDEDESADDTDDDDGDSDVETASLNQV